MQAICYYDIYAQEICKTSNYATSITTDDALIYLNDIMLEDKFDK